MKRCFSQRKNMCKNNRKPQTKNSTYSARRKKPFSAAFRRRVAPGNSDKESSHHVVKSDDAEERIP